MIPISMSATGCLKSSTPQDLPEGTLHLALGPRSYHGSWWDHAATYLSNAIEEADQHGDLADSSWKSMFTG